MKLFSVLLTCLFLMCCATLSLALDFDFGSTARSVSLGGAGLALGDEFHSTAVINPAAPAVHGKKVKILFPGLDFKKTGASLGDVIDNIDKLSSSNSTNALSLANDFASQKTSLGVSTVAGFSGTTGILLNAELVGQILPGKDMMNWSLARLGIDSGIKFNPKQYTARLNNSNLNAAVASWDAYSTSGLSADKDAAEAAFGRYLVDLSNNSISAAFLWGPTVQLSSKFPSRSGDLWLGTNISLLTSESREWTITAKNPSFTYTGQDISLSKLDFDAGEAPTQRKTSLKMDVGMLYRPENSVWQYGVVLNNLIKPKIRGIESSQEDVMISVGVASEPIRNLIFAADLVNITGANSESMRLRTGVEMNMGKLFTLRAGYSGDKLTYGFSLFGVDLAFAKGSPNILSKVFKY